MSSVAPTSTQLLNIITADQPTAVSSDHPKAPVFDVKRATDASYYGVYAKDFVEHYNATKGSDDTLLLLRTQVKGGRSLFGIVEFMFVFGCYASRKSASDAWYNLKTNWLKPGGSLPITHRLSLPSTPVEVGDPGAPEPSSHCPRTRPNGGKFWTSIGRYDYCTLADFLDHILDHLTGKVAETIGLRAGKHRPWCLLALTSQLP